MPKNLVEKIAEAFQGVDTILKLGDNGQYAYLRILDIANGIREKLLAAGVLIIPADQNCEISQWESDVPGRMWHSAKVFTMFTITDGVTPLTFSAYGYARDMDGKCVAIAQTAALKSFLKRMALIFGDYDDPEREPDHIADLRPDLQRKIDEQTMIKGIDIRAFNAACKKNGRTLEEVQEFLKTNLAIDDVKQILQMDFKRAMAWAYKEEYSDEAPRVDS
jgi:hypothetical protein